MNDQITPEQTVRIRLQIAEMLARKNADWTAQSLAEETLYLADAIFSGTLPPAVDRFH